MQVSVEAPSNLERRLTIIIPVEKIDQEIEQRLIEFSKIAKKDGYRPGKVPLNYVRQQYGQAARQEALNEVMKTSLYAAIEQEKLNPVSMPAIEPKAMLPGQPLEFVATFEVLPTIAQVNFKLDNIEKEVATIADIDIQQVIDKLSEQRTIWHPVDRPAQDKDQVTIDFLGRIDGVAFPGGEAHDYPIIIGSKTMLPGFEDGLLGTTVGQEKVLTIPFPENYFAKEIAGKSAEFTVKILKICEPELPEMTEAFIKTLGIKSGSASDLQAEITKNLQRELERVIKTKLKIKLFDQLLEQNPIEVPKALIDEEAGRIHDQMHPNHQGKHHEHSETEIAGFKEAAKRSVMLGLLVGELAKQRNITPDKKRIQDFITNIATAYENPAEIIQWYTRNQRQMAEVEMQVLEEQIMEKLLEDVTVTEKMLTYNELVSH